MLACLQLLQVDGGKRIELLNLALLRVADGVAPLACFDVLRNGAALRNRPAKQGVATMLL